MAPSREVWTWFRVHPFQLDAHYGLYEEPVAQQKPLTKGLDHRSATQCQQRSLKSNGGREMGNMVICFGELEEKRGYDEDDRRG
jgi:hypothetical protein